MILANFTNHNKKCMFLAIPSSFFRFHQNKKIWNSNLNHSQPLLFLTFPPVVNFIILVLLRLTCWQIYILGFGQMEDNLRLNKDLFSTKVYLLPILKTWIKVQTGKIEEHPTCSHRMPHSGGKALMALKKNNFFCGFPKLSSPPNVFSSSEWSKTYSFEKAQFCNKHIFA